MEKILNIENGLFTSNEYEIPIIYGDYVDPNEYELNRYNIRKPNGGCHFFAPDYMFESIWNTPNRVLGRIIEFDYVLTPDFSMYDMMPLPLQYFNHYRNNWCGVFWQEVGARVIPSMTWSYRVPIDVTVTSFDPRSPVVAISNHGVEVEDQWVYAFDVIDNYFYDLEHIIIYGKNQWIDNDDERICFFEGAYTE